MDTYKTQYSAGGKSPKINVKFRADVYEYIRIMAGVRGVSMTHFVNDVIAADKRRNGSVFAMAKAIQKEENKNDND